MRKIKFDVREEEYSIVSFEIDVVISPEDLAAITPPKVYGSKGVTHFYHPTKFIATYEPGSVLNLKYHQEYEEGKAK